MNNMEYPRFELVTRFAGQEDLIPQRATFESAGYDLKVAEDTIVPTYFRPENGGFGHLHFHMDQDYHDRPVTLEEIATETKRLQVKPTLVSTGLKAFIPREMFLQLQVRSSLPLKHWLIIANAPGIVDGDYYNNPDNEGEIFLQLINLSPRDILLKRGDRIGQGIFLFHSITASDKPILTTRQGGFGSTS